MRGDEGGATCESGDAELSPSSWVNVPVGNSISVTLRACTAQPAACSRSRRHRCSPPRPSPAWCDRRERVLRTAQYQRRHGQPACGFRHVHGFGGGHVLRLLDSDLLRAFRSLRTGRNGQRRNTNGNEQNVFMSVISSKKAAAHRRCLPVAKADRALTSDCGGTQRPGAA